MKLSSSYRGKENTLYNDSMMIKVNNSGVTLEEFKHKQGNRKSVYVELYNHEIIEIVKRKLDKRIPKRVVNWIALILDKGIR